jgi:hypothetical protein
MIFVLSIMFSLPACKAKECPAFQEAKMTGGSPDKNKKNKKKRGRGSVFDKKIMKRYNR